MAAAPELEARIERLGDHGGDTRSLFLRLPGGQRLLFVPGQFISCHLPVGGEVLTRPYSLASSPEDEQLEICLDRVPAGRGSAYLLGLPVGATVRFTGPWGNFTLERAPDAEAVFIADGTGIAPIRPMLRRALATGGRHPLRLLYGTGAGQPVLYRGDFEHLAREHAAFGFEHVASAALPDEVARRWVDADADRSRRFFVCGVGQIVLALRDLLRHAGYERRAVQYEKW